MEGSEQDFRFGDDVYVSEAPIAPRTSSTREDDAYVSSAAVTDAGSLP